MNVAILERERIAAIVRDRGALESAVMRPQMVAHYEQADLIAQAATLIAGIALAHPFLDANKRTALAAGATFLALNGLQVLDAGDDFGRQIEALVLRHTDARAALDDLEVWLRAHVAPV